MTAKDKAKELLDKFEPYVMIYSQDDVVGWLSEETPIFEYQKQCALIAVDEILDLNLGLSNCDENNWDIDKFYLEVKQEIEKL